eukprot:2076837-Amphidinium_carterae.1
MIGRKARVRMGQQKVHADLSRASCNNQGSQSCKGNGKEEGKGNKANGKGKHMPKSSKKATKTELECVSSMG